MAVDPADRRQTLRRSDGNRVLVVQRVPKAERAAERRLGELGLKGVGPAHGSAEYGGGRAFVSRSGLEQDWWRLVHEGLPRLREEGWSVKVDPSFRHRVLDAAGDWNAAVGDTGNAWFSFDLGIIIDGVRVSLLPVLADALRYLPPGSDRGAREIPSSAGTFYARLDDSHVLALPADRVRPMLETLVELFDRKALGADGKLDISLSQALALAEHEAALRLRWVGAAPLVEMAAALRRFGGLGEAEPPAGLRATLRPYQRHGLAWLQHLRANGARRHPRRRHGPRQDAADDRPPRRREGGRPPRRARRWSSRRPAWSATGAASCSGSRPSCASLVLHGAARRAALLGQRRSDVVLTTYALLRARRGAAGERDSRC